MNKILKYSLITIISFFVILYLFAIISPIVSHPDCYKGGGVWRSFPDSCVDSCGAEVCAEVFTQGCDCGEGSCWDGNSCVIEEEKFCETDEDCLTSCNSPSGFAGLGSQCYNAEYVRNQWEGKDSHINSPIDGVCCACDDATKPFSCGCVNNVCVSNFE